jgi:hypothetical protein
MQHDSHHSTASQTSDADNLLYCPTPAIITIIEELLINQSLILYFTHSMLLKKNDAYDDKEWRVKSRIGQNEISISQNSAY